MEALTEENMIYLCLLVLIRTILYVESDLQRQQVPKEEAQVPLASPPAAEHSDSV